MHIIFRIIAALICLLAIGLAYYAYVESKSMTWTIIYGVIAFIAAGSAGLIRKR